MQGRIAGVLVLGLLAASWAHAREPATRDAAAKQAEDRNARSVVQKAGATNVKSPATQNAANTGDKLVLEVPSNQWFEGPLERVTVSGNGRWAIINRRGVQPNLQLFSLQTGREDLLALMADLNRVDNAVFCGPGNGLARLGERTVEDGWFLPHDDSEELSQLPADAMPVCASDETELAYYRANATDEEVFIDAEGRVRDYGVSGRITGMAFSPDNNFFYALLFLPSGESSLVRIEVSTGASRVMASHLDASPLSEHISVSPDGRKMYLALASDDVPVNEARHQPEGDRWLKIYELDLSTAAQRRIVDTPGADNNAPTIVGNDLYWTRTVYQPSIVLVPAGGGDGKELVAGGQLPMWSPDSRRIGYFFGGARQADWGLDLDDAVVGVDEQGNRASQPSVIVSGYGEDFPPAWSPDGKWIAFHSHRSSKPVPQYGDPASTDDIYLRKADDVHAPEIRLTDFGWETGPAYWSPDGTKLMFNSWDRDGQPGIDKLWVLNMNPETGRLLRIEKLALPAEIRSASWAAWSPDGEEIAIEDNRGGQDRTLWTVHADGSHAQKVVDYKGTTYDGLDWLPEGKTIVYSALANGRLQLFAIPSLGGVPRQLTRDSGNLLHPKLSPDGKWIACTRVVQSKQIWRRRIN
jgi:Tol biopolymer transport system component